MDKTTTFKKCAEFLYDNKIENKNDYNAMANRYYYYVYRTAKKMYFDKYISVKSNKSYDRYKIKHEELLNKISEMATNVITRLRHQDPEKTFLLQNLGGNFQDLKDSREKADYTDNHINKAEIDDIKEKVFDIEAALNHLF